MTRNAIRIQRGANVILLQISVVERLRMQFLTSFHKILHMAWKRGRLDAYYF